MHSAVLTIAKYVPKSVREFIRAHRSVDTATRKAYSLLMLLGGRVATVKSGPMAGIKLVVSPYTSHTHIRGNYESETMCAIDHLVQHGMICYDLGASIGYVSLLMARKAKHVYSFEPAPHSRDQLQKNIAANGFRNVTVIPSPVSDGTRDVEFALTDNAYGSAIAQEPSAKWPKITLTTVSIDEFASCHEAPDFIKIDVEEEEGRVLKGATRVLSNKRPIICCEIHTIECAQEAQFILLDRGYNIRDQHGRPFVIPSEIIQGDLQIFAFPS